MGFWDIFWFVFYVVAAYYLILLGIGVGALIFFCIIAVFNKGRWY